jgi:DNA repair exonuclease SbcCD nuclease subunit
MKFVHIADMHFDCPFSNLALRDGLTEKRRLEQRNVFKKVINYIKENNVNYLFISGDFYENENIRKSTIIYINELFIEIPNTKIFISPRKS